MTSDECTFTFDELCERAGVAPAPALYWVRARLLLPAVESRGTGSKHRFNVENIIDATLLGELTRAGLSARQLRKIVEAERARLALLTPAARLVEKFRFYINSIVRLAALFGRGPDFERWLQVQTRMLHRMEAALTRHGDADLDRRVLDMLVAGRSAREGQAAA